MLSDIYKRLLLSAQLLKVSDGSALGSALRSALGTAMEKRWPGLWGSASPVCLSYSSLGVIPMIVARGLRVLCTLACSVGNVDRAAAK